MSRAMKPRVEPRGPDLLGSGHCPRCGWSYDLHPLDADGVDVCRCPAPSENEQIAAMLDKHKRELLALAVSFPATLWAVHSTARHQ